MWTVYLLRCHDGSLYCGITTDLLRRVRQHEAGKGSKYVRSRLPVRIEWFTYCDSRLAAMRRESQIKRMRKIRKEKLASSPTP